MDQGVVTLIVDVATACEEVQPKVVWAWAVHFGFPQRILTVLCHYFHHQGRVIIEGCVADPLQTITAILAGSGWSRLLLSIVLQDAVSEVLKVHPPSKLKVFVDDIRLNYWGKNEEVLQAAPRVLCKLKTCVSLSKIEVIDRGRE